MTTEKHDPWALLRQARKVADAVVTDARSIAFAQWSPEQHEAEAVRDRIDAALAERQDSAQNAMEWRPSDQRVFLEGVSLRVVLHTDGVWVWSVYWPVSHRTEQGRVATEAEAKTAAIAAARGTK
jgi:DNA primase